MSGKECTVERCDRAAYKRGICRGHYARVQRHGDVRAHIPLRQKKSSPEESFALRTEWRGGCLVWTGGMHKEGYGVIWDGRKVQRAHRWVWEKANGPIPEGAMIDHACFNRKCVNINHLRLATPNQNGSNLSYTSSGSKTEVRNVYRHGKGYSVQIQKEGRLFYFGTYQSIGEATELAERKREELFGEYAGRGRVA